MWCSPCERSGSYNQVAGLSLCDVHLWQWEATRLSPTYMDAWLKREKTRTGQLIPAVLRPDFKLRRCPVCDDIVKPWKRRGSWCSPSDYRRAKTCPRKACVVQAARARSEPLHAGLGRPGSRPWGR